MTDSGEALRLEEFEQCGYVGMAERHVLYLLPEIVLPDVHRHARSGRILRESLYRATARVEWPGIGPVVFKAHRSRGKAKDLLTLVRSERAWAEWSAACYLRAAGLPVAPPLAVGQRRRRGVLVDSFFAAEFLEDAETFDEAFRRAVDAEGTCPGLLEEAGRLLRSMHDARFDHRDLHAGNVLVRRGPDETRRLVLVDLHRRRMGRHVGRAARRDANARWLHSLLPGGLGPEGVVATLRAYAPELRDGALRRVCGDIGRRIDELERIRRHSRARRCLLESTVYTRDVHPGYGARRRDLSKARLDRALEAHDEALAGGTDRVVKIGRKSRLTRHDAVVVKENVPFGLLGRMKDRLAPRRHQAGYRGAHLLGVLGVATATPLAWVRRGGRVFTLYEDLGDLERLDHVARTLYRAPEREPQVELRRASADWLGQLHRRGIYHGDLKGVNVLVRRGSAVPPKLHLIDTDRIRVFDGPVDYRRCVKNLAQLAASIPLSVTKTERLRWFRRYAANSPLPPVERRVARDVQAHLDRKIVVRDEPIE